VAGFVLFVISATTTMGAVAASDGNTHWMATWATASKVPTPIFDPVVAPVFPTINDATLRQVVRISVGGEKFRVWFTNEFGTDELNIGEARIALRELGSAIVPGSDEQLTFGGESSISIPVGARAVSDPVSITIPDLTDVAISIYLPDDISGSSSPVSYHVRALQSNYIGSLNQTWHQDIVRSQVEPFASWFFLAAVDVALHRPIPVIAALGDSITDGDQVADSPPIDENARYTDFLARLIIDRDNPGKGHRFGQLASVINLGISGGQASSTLIGENALARLDRDVLSQSGVTHVIFLEGINDIGLPVLLQTFGLTPILEGIFGRAFPVISAAEIISVHRQVATRAKANGLIAVGATLLPSGAASPAALPGYQGAVTEAKRQAVNDFIRNSGVYDLVIDFDEVMRDPNDATIMNPALNSGDGLHPNSAGYEAMAEEAFRKLRHSR
jgi:lysophospholipase L1-like esterase